MFEKKLLGHSGCDIRLIEEGPFRFVRKFSSSPDYNHRLKAQCDKQRGYSAGSFKVPRVMGEGTDGGLYYFDMEYIQGVTLAKRLERMHMSDVPKIARELFDAIYGAGPACGAGSHLGDVIREKARSTYAAIDSPGIEVETAFRLLVGHDWSLVGPGGCHGDMTFENIMISNGELYLIDFLDSFCDSWVIDMAKVYQDVDSMWSFRASAKNNTSVKLLVMRNLFDRWLSLADPLLVVEVRYMLLLNLLRIYPYAGDRETVLFLDGRLSCVLDEIRKIERACR